MIKYKPIPCLILLSLIMLAFISMPSCSKNAEDLASDHTVIKTTDQTLDPVALALNPAINSTLTTSSFPLVTATEYAQSTPIEQSLITKVQTELDKLILYQEAPTAIPDRTIYTRFFTAPGGFSYSIIGPPPTEPDTDPAVHHCTICSVNSAYNCIMYILYYTTTQGITSVNINIGRTPAGCVIIRWGMQGVLSPPLTFPELPPTNP